MKLAAPTRVVIVDDDEAARFSLQLVLAELGGFVCVGGFERGDQALAAIRTLAPALVLTDIVRPGMTGLEFIRRLRRRWPETRVIVVTGLFDAVRAAKEAGASAYLAKPASLDQLRRALTAASEVSFYVSEQLLTQKVESAPLLDTKLAYPAFLTVHAWRLWEAHKAEAGFWPGLGSGAKHRPRNLARLYQRSETRCRSDWHYCFGLSPRRWCDLLQIHAIMTLALTTDIKLDDIPSLVGLKSASAMRAKFQRVAGQSLRDWRRTALRTGL